MEKVVLSGSSRLALPKPNCGQLHLKGKCSCSRDKGQIALYTSFLYCTNEVTEAAEGMLESSHLQNSLLIHLDFLSAEHMRFLRMPTCW